VDDPLDVLIEYHHEPLVDGLLELVYFQGVGHLIGL
jgi:hypothetical protein